MNVQKCNSSLRSNDPSSIDVAELIAFEELAAGAVWMRYQVLDSTIQRREFLADLRISQRELGHLADLHNVNYDLPRMGEAYALRYHMLRTFNVQKALRAVFRDGCPTKLTIADIGSGTGATSSALLLFALSNRSRITALVSEIEPSSSMKDVAADIHSRQSAYSKTRSSGTIQVEPISTSQSTLDEFVSFNSGTYDVIVYSLTFDFMGSDTRLRDCAAQVVSSASLLEQTGGKLILVTPRSGSKIKLLEKCVSALNTLGLELQTELEPSGTTLQHRPDPIIRVRKLLNLQARNLGVARPYPNGPADGIYYGDFTSIHVFTTPMSTPK